MLIYQLSLVLGVMNIVNGAICVFVFGVAGQSLVGLFVWYALLVMAAGLQIYAWMRVRNRPPPKRVSVRSMKRAETLTLVFGCLWGAFAVLFYPPDAIPYQLFMCLIVAGNSGGVSSLLNPAPTLTRRFLIAVNAPLACRMLIDGQEFHIALVLLAVFFAVALYRGSMRSYWQLKEMVQSNFQTEQARSLLDDAIESANDGFAIFDSEGQLLTANSRYRHWFPDDGVHAPVDDGAPHKVHDGDWVLSKSRPIRQGGWVSVHADVTALKRREEELLLAKQNAEEADRAKAEFLSNIGHELRTPLNAVIGFSQIIRQQIYGDIGDKRYLEHIQDIEDSGRHLLSIINDILDVARIESARYEIEPDEVDVDEVIEWVVSTCREAPDKAPRTVEVDTDPDLKSLLVDPRAFKQILTNLLSNALKFSDDDSPVGVRAALLEDGRARIEVWDCGVGIPPDRITDVTRAFVQGENSLRKTHGGSGLGLAICRALSELHDGSLSITSKVGEGTQVEVLLPASCVVDVGAGPSSSVA